MPNNNNYIAVVPLNQTIYNTPYHQKKFASVGVTVPDEPLPTLIQIVANDEYFKAPSSKAVYDAINVLRQVSVSNDLVVNTIDKNNFDPNSIPNANAVVNAINSIVVQDIQDNIIDKVVSSDALYDALNDLTLNQIQMTSYEFIIPALEWTVNHNKNTYLFQENIIDSDGNKIYANVKILDSNNFRILFTEPTSGTVVVKF